MEIKSSLLAIGVMTVFIFHTDVASAEQPMPEVARKAGCVMCHKVESKLIGPAFAWIADKYKDDKAAGKKAIVDQIIKGGNRKWIRYTGGILMPPYESTTTEQQRDELAEFIMSLEPVAPPER